MVVLQGRVAGHFRCLVVLIEHRVWSGKYLVCEAVVVVV